MNNQNTIVKYASDSLIRAEAYCRIIKELFIFMGCEPYTEDYLNYTIEDDIRKFILKQEKKLSDLILKGAL